jgi:hypothetical protein
MDSEVKLLCERFRCLRLRDRVLELEDDPNTSTNILHPSSPIKLLLKSITTNPTTLNFYKKNPISPALISFSPTSNSFIVHYLCTPLLIRLIPFFPDVGAGQVQILYTENWDG